MKSNDLNAKTRDDIRAMMQKAIKENDMEAFSESFNQMLGCIQEEIEAQYEQRINEMQQEMDSQILSSRGVRQLTSEERNYYMKLADAMKSKDPKQALTNLDVVMPKTTINRVFEDLRTEHPLLARINFVPSGGAVELIMNENGYQEAAWGKLCDEIVKELTAGFKVVNATLLKLSAFLPVCKAMLELGPEWLDNYVRQVLYEALANGLEAGIVAGDGNDKPIGMNRQVGDGVTVTGGVYPEKQKIAVGDLSVDTLGNLLSLITVDPSGKARVGRDLLLLVNPQDYFQKVMPATTLMAPDGSYRNDVLPYPVTVIQTAALDRGNAILGMGYRYFAVAGTAKEGKIESSDHYRFLEDERVYLIKAYANGMPMDNNAFLYLDISGLKPAVWKMVQESAPAAANDATLSDLRIGNNTLTPAFAPGTDKYTVTTKNEKNTIQATPAEAGAEIEVFVGDDEIDNGASFEWKDGANTVVINVTAADGTTKQTYTVTVTKS